MNRAQSFHETFIPLLVDVLGVTAYLELGTGRNETMSRVFCPRRYGVDRDPVPCEGVTMFAMSTEDFLRTKAAAFAPYQLVFIDADHSARAVEADFFGVWPFVEPEGLVVMHDTNPELAQDTVPGLCGDAWVFARHLTDRRGPTYEILTLAYHPGLTLVRKRQHWGPIDA